MLGLEDRGGPATQDTALPTPRVPAQLSQRRPRALRRQLRRCGQLRALQLCRPVEDPRFKEPPLKTSGDADRYDHREGNDDYTQPGNLLHLMTVEQRRPLFANTAAAMAGGARGDPAAPDRRLHKSRSGLRPRRCPRPWGWSSPSPPNNRHRGRGRMAREAVSYVKHVYLIKRV